MDDDRNEHLRGTIMLGTDGYNWGAFGYQILAVGGETVEVWVSRATVDEYRRTFPGSWSRCVANALRDQLAEALIPLQVGDEIIQMLDKSVLHSEDE